MPWTDWQFWVVTIAAFVSVTLAARVLIPKRKSKVRTNLTIAGQPAKRKR